MNKFEFDVIIIGGGPAGSVAGIYLSKYGFRTAVIERKPFPRETLCGEFLSLEVADQLRSLCLEDKFLSLQPNKISSFKFINRNRVFSSDLPFPAFALKRSIFDEFLLKEAEDAGANLFQPAEVKEVIRKGEGFIVRIFSEGELRELSSRFVVGAFGKNSQIDKKLQREFSGKTTGYYGIKFHACKTELSEINNSCIYIFQGDNIYTGINSVGRGEVTVCFLERNKGEKVSPANHLARLFEENKYLSAVFNSQPPDLRKYEVYGAGNIYFGRKELVKNGIIMIGDAARIIAPLAGDGIGMAFQSAQIAADVIKEASEKNMNFESIKKIYTVKWNQLFSRRVFTARFIQNIILRNSFINIIPAPLINFFVPALISATRK